MTDIQATSIQDRTQALQVAKGDRVIYNGFTLEVTEIKVAMGGDVCLCGNVRSWLYEHQYKVYFDDYVLWGPKGLSKSLEDYLRGIFIGRRETS